MVRRRCLCKLPPFERQAIQFVPHTLSGRVLRGTAQPPLFQTQSLLLKITQTWGLPLLSLRSRLATTSVGPYTYCLRRINASSVSNACSSSPCARTRSRLLHFSRARENL